MVKKQLINYLWCIILLMIAVFSFLVFFTVDVLVFQVKETIFTAFYGYGLFPAFSVIYGQFSYRTTKKIILPNILYLLFCTIFIILFINIGSAYLSGLTSAVLQELKFALGVIGIITAISIIISSVISIVTSIITKIKTQTNY